MDVLIPNGYQQATDTATKQKNSFINKRCEMCGDEDCSGRALSELRLTCGYGSKYDGEQVSLTICGNCAGRILDIIQRKGED